MILGDKPLISEVVLSQIQLTFVDKPSGRRGCLDIRALEVASEDLSEVIPTIDNVSWQIIQPCSGRIC
jgi:hypothetical protein